MSSVDPSSSALQHPRRLGKKFLIVDISLGRKSSATKVTPTDGFVEFHLSRNPYHDQLMLKFSTAGRTEI